MILLDTNVLSEMMKPRPNAAVDAWLDRQQPALCLISSVSEAELGYGIAILPAGQRRDALAAALEAVLAEGFAQRVAPFDRAAAIVYAEIAAARRRAGQPISYPDAQIAAIAKSRATAVATRNVADFANCGITIIDPWNA